MDKYPKMRVPKRFIENVRNISQQTGLTMTKVIEKYYVCSIPNGSDPENLHYENTPVTGHITSFIISEIENRQEGEE